MDQEDRDPDETANNVDDEDDMEGMDGKAKALTNLLKTSSVCDASAPRFRTWQLIRLQRSSSLSWQTR